MLRLGRKGELAQIAVNRRLFLKAVYVAQEMGLLRFGEVCGFSSWIITDASGICAEGRRLDGKPDPATKQLGQRKAHTIRHSAKNWPVGILPDVSCGQSFDVIALVEGGPDLYKPAPD
jgi:hypothetical protein